MVYFIRAGESDAVKIGCALSAEARLEQLQLGNPHKLKIIRTIPGGRKIEAAAHKHFAAHRVRSEWFTFNDGMMAWEPPLALTSKKHKSMSLRQLLAEYNGAIVRSIDVARACGLTRQAIGQWKVVPLAHLETVAKLFGKHPSELRSDIFNKPAKARGKRK